MTTCDPTGSLLYWLGPVILFAGIWVGARMARR